MDDNTKNTQAQQNGQQPQGGADQQHEKLFTQADVDRIINSRLARMRQDVDTADQYRRERDDARKELEQYKNDAFLTAKGVRDDDKDYITFKAGQLVDENTNFQQAVEKYLKENPRFTGPVYRVSTGVSNSDECSGRSVRHDTDDIRKAMGLKG